LEALEEVKQRHRIRMDKVLPGRMPAAKEGRVDRMKRMAMEKAMPPIPIRPRRVKTDPVPTPASVSKVVDAPKPVEEKPKEHLERIPRALKPGDSGYSLPLLSSAEEDRLTALDTPITVGISSLDEPITSKLVKTPAPKAAPKERDPKPGEPGYSRTGSGGILFSCFIVTLIPGPPNSPKP